MRGSASADAADAADIGIGIDRGGPAAASCQVRQRPVREGELSSQQRLFRDLTAGGGEGGGGVGGAGRGAAIGGAGGIFFEQEEKEEEEEDGGADGLDASESEELERAMAMSQQLTGAASPAAVDEIGWTAALVAATAAEDGKSGGSATAKSKHLAAILSSGIKDLATDPRALDDLEALMRRMANTGIDRGAVSTSGILWHVRNRVVCLS